MTDYLCCEQVSLHELAQHYGTPLYVYSQQALDDAFTRYQQAFGDLNPLICYAVKANSNLSVLRYFAKLGSGFDIVSGGELARVLTAGGDARKTIFSGVGKSEAEIEFALKNHILCFNVESIPELTRIHHIAKRLNLQAPISLRINPDIDAQTHPYISTGLKANKFGIAYGDAIDAYLYAQQLSHINIMGIDCHIGSQLTDLSPMVEALDRLLLLIDALVARGIVLSHIDLGGGIGIVYHDEPEPDVQAYAQHVKQRLQRYKTHRVILEPGRSLVGKAGILLTTVEYIKHGEAKNFVVVDAAMNDLIRPALYHAYHRIENTAHVTDAALIKADVVGPICETGDFLGQDCMIAAQPGDVLAIADVGAYAASMASNYNSRPRAAEVWVHGHHHRCIRQRESWEHLWAHELAYLQD